MLTSLIAIGLGLLGLVLGSFAGASVWRLRARQLKDDKKAGEEVDKKEYAKLAKLLKHTVMKDRSQCLHCGYELTWRDLVPLFSWLSLGGRCRECRKPIGYFEPIIELGVAAYFILSFVLWPVTLVGFIPCFIFALWLIGGVLMAMLFAYDAKWLLLPDRINYALIGIGVVTAVLTIAIDPKPFDALLGILGGLLILSGTYLLLYIISNGRWIGFGDIKLGAGLALLIADWRIALMALFFANLIGTLIVIPMLATKRMKRNSHLPFGPLLIAGAILAKFVGLMIVDLYLFSVY
ncbi:MAG: putative Prepilin peptidase [Candidatus Saccharibacteria bacterium]|nr:putative Prepilin peptidase [Candidatus Saccharibacteria bacterium]